MVRPGRIDEAIHRPFAGGPLGVFLEPALGTLERADRRSRRRAPGRPARPASRGRPRTRRRGTARRASASKDDARSVGRRRPSRCDSPSPSSRTSPRSMRAARRARPAVETIAARRARQVALVVIGVALVQRLRDGEVHDGVTQVLEAFVVAARRVGVLVQPARVDERLLEQAFVSDGEARVAAAVRLGRIPPRCVGD